MSWKLVPIEATPEMVVAAFKDQPDSIQAGYAQSYSIMVEHAPTPPAASPFIWICLVPASTEANPDPDPRIRAWTANPERAIELTASGLDMVPVFVRPPTRDEAFDAYRRTMTRIVVDLRARLEKVKEETGAALRATGRCADAQQPLVQDALLGALKGLVVAYGATDGRNGNSGECWDKARAAVALAAQPPAAPVETECDTVKHMWGQVEKARADGTFSSPLSCSSAGTVQLADALQEVWAMGGKPDAEFQTEVLAALRGNAAQPQSPTEREKRLLAEKLQDKKDLYDYCVRAEAAEKLLERASNAIGALLQWTSNWTVSFEGEDEWLGDKDVALRVRDEIGSVLSRPQQEPKDG